MKKVWEYANNILMEFRCCFSREASFKWFIVATIGFLLRSDHLGVTSIVREFQTSSDLFYENLIHFFHSTSWTLSKLQNKWLEIVRNSGNIYDAFGKPLIIGDGVKKPKEGKYMPGVKKTHFESGNSSKRQYYMAHLFGALGIVVGNKYKQFCAPISMTIQDGCQPILEWIESEYAKDSHVTCLVRQACKAAAHMCKECFLLLDCYFLSEAALIAMAEEAQKAGKAFVNMITKAKTDYVAFEKPGKFKNGKSRKIGKKIKLRDLFTDKINDFVSVDLTLYGKIQTVQYYCVNLLWGRNLKQELRFVLTIYKGKANTILVSTDLSLHPEQIIQLYSIRFKIEVLFRAFNQCIAGMGYHFWTKHLPRLNPFETAKAAAEKLAKITNPKSKERIISTYRASECFVMLCCIAIGILQLCSLNFTAILNLSPIRWQRTYTNIVPSEESTRVSMRESFNKLFYKSPNMGIVKIISEKKEEFGPLYKNTA